eukprot:3139047-Amphidinium_carterae.1
MADNLTRSTNRSSEKRFRYADLLTEFTSKECKADFPFLTGKCHNCQVQSKRGIIPFSECELLTG